MIALEQAGGCREQLGLSQAALMLESRLESAAHKDLPYAEFMVDFLRMEATARWERYLKIRRRLAHLLFAGRPAPGPSRAPPGPADAGLHRTENPDH